MSYWASGLIKIVGVEVHVDAVHPLHLLRPHRRHTVLVLKHTIDNQKRFVHDHEAIAGKKVGAHDDVGDTSFILECEEDESLRGTGPLAGDHHSGHTHAT